jgi:hypothetical protein
MYFRKPTHVGWLSCVRNERGEDEREREVIVREVGEEKLGQNKTVFLR